MFKLENKLSIIPCRVMPNPLKNVQDVSRAAAFVDNIKTYNYVQQSS
jgi:hypothetical protein